MSLQDLKAQSRQLTVNDRLELVRSIIESLQDTPSQEPQRSQRDICLSRSRVIKQMKGLLKTDQPAPTDEQVEAMLEERCLEKYL